MAKCKVCGREASEINEYQEFIRTGQYETIEEVIKNEEGTYNPETDLFYCTNCYIKIGMPLGKA